MAFNWFGLRKSPVQAIDNPTRGFSLTAGEFIDSDSAMEISAYYSGVIYISTQIAKLPWRVKSKDFNILYDDPIGYLLDLIPNPETDSFSFRLALIQDAIHSGNGYAEIERDVLGRPKALWHIPATNVEPLRTVDGNLVYRIIGGSTARMGEDAYLPASDIFHIKNFHTKDGIVGQGLVAYAKNSLGISAAADKQAGNLFANGGLPSGTIEVAGTLKPEAYERIKASWKAAHGGRKSGGIAVLESGAKYNPVSIDPEVMQFLESRKFGVEEIARFLRIPPSKMFMVSAQTYNNSENANLEVATDTLDAWAKMLELQADIKLLKSRFGGKHTELDLYAVFRGDMESRANYFSKMMQMSAISPNEIRRREGLAAYKGGDRYYVAVNNYTPADRVDEVIDSQVSKSDNKDSVNPDKSKEDIEKSLMKAAVDFLGK